MMNIAHSVGQAFDLRQRLVGVAVEIGDSKLHQTDKFSSQHVESSKISWEKKVDTFPVIVKKKVPEPSGVTNTSLNADARVNLSSSNGTPSTLPISLTVFNSIDKNNATVPHPGMSFYAEISVHIGLFCILKHRFLSRVV